MAEDTKQPVQNKNTKNSKNANAKVPNPSQIKQDKNLDQNFDRDNKMERDQER